jgi:hypothetical protein
MSASAAPLLPAAASGGIHDALETLADAGFASILPVLTPLPATLPESEVRALAEVSLRQSHTTHAKAESARLRYTATFLDLYRQADTPNAVAARLGLDPSRIRQRIRDHTLLAIECNDEKRIPRCQFEDDIEVPGMARLVAATWRTMTPLAFAMWFTTPTADLAASDADTPLSPREWLLRTGEVDSVLALADTL